MMSGLFCFHGKVGLKNIYMIFFRVFLNLCTVSQNFQKRFIRDQNLIAASVFPSTPATLVFESDAEYLARHVCPLKERTNQRDQLQAKRFITMNFGSFHHYIQFDFILFIYFFADHHNIDIANRKNSSVRAKYLAEVVASFNSLQDDVYP